MKRFPRISMLFTLMLLTLNAAASVTGAKIDEMVQQFVDAGRFNGSVLVARGDDVILAKGYGLADHSWEIPNKSDTSILVGSVSKQFTSLIIMQLVKEGKIDLMAPISKYLPDFPKETGDKVTIHNLLCHDSGMPHYAGFRRVGIDLTSIMGVHTDVSRYVEMIGKLKLEFEPGEKHSYSSMGYIVLGYIIEKVTGQTFTEAMENRISKPLGLKGTGFNMAAQITPKLARGYMLDWQSQGDDSVKMGYTNEPYRDQSNKYCTGGVHSTVEDLFAWSRALTSNKLLPKKYTDMMWTPHAENYGYGWRIAKGDFGLDDDTEIISHGGSLSGFKAYIAIINRGEYTLVALGNTNRSWSRPMMQSIARVIHGKEPYPYDVAGTRLTIRMVEQGIEAGQDWFEAAKANGMKGYNTNEFAYWANMQDMMRFNKPDIALAVARIGMSEHPDSAELHYHAAEAFKKAGETDEAIKALSRCMKIIESNTDHGLSPVLVEQGRMRLKQWRSGSQP